MLTIKLTLLAIVISAISLSAHAENFGKFVGYVDVEWLPDGRNVRLLAPFEYVDPAGEKWSVPTGWVVDGSSVPKIAWSVIGEPFEGKHRNAAVIHDFACDLRTKPWETVHELFYWAMRAAGVASLPAKLAYAAVYHFGPRWTREVTISNLPQEQAQKALEQALRQAVPGSMAEIINVNLRYHTFSGIPTGLANFDILIYPPPKELADEEFEILKSQIEERERDGSEGLSLHEIRAYKSKH